MKQYMTVGMSMIAGAALGAAAVQTLHAQAKPLGYVIAENIVNDRDGYTKDFIPPITKTIQEAGGKFIVRGGKTVPMHGTPPAPRVVVVQFESLAKAQEWANSSAAKAAFAIGEKYSTLHDYAVEGVSP